MKFSLYDALAGMQVDCGGHVASRQYQTVTDGVFSVLLGIQRRSNGI